MTQIFTFQNTCGYTQIETSSLFVFVCFEQILQQIVKNYRVCWMKNRFENEIVFFYLDCDVNDLQLTVIFFSKVANCVR